MINSTCCFQKDKMYNNKKLIIIFFTCILLVMFFPSCKTFSPKEYYIIDGAIKNYIGKIYLLKAVDSKFYFDNFNADSSIVSNGKFEFKLSKKNDFPLPFYIMAENDLRTYRFILEPKNQKLIIDSLYFNVTPKIICENSTIVYEEQILEERTKPLLEKFMLEYKKITSSSYSNEMIEKLVMSKREKLTKETDSIFVDFVKEHSNSYFSLWETIIKHSYNGNTKEMEKAYNNLSSTIKETKVARLLEEDLLKAKTLNPGNHFPEMKLKNKNLEEIIFNISGMYDTEYTLIDFWFSHCGPCIKQFPKLKKIYSEYNQGKLEIISISTDKTKNVDNWHKIIQQNEIKWHNLLDENGVESSILSINKFPTNFLLNNQGEILRRDISLTELETILKNNKK